MRVVPPSTIPPAVALADVKLDLRIEVDTEDSILTEKFTDATARAQHLLGRALVTQTWAIKLDQFPCSDSIRLLMPPVSAITSIVYTDADGNEQTMPAADYELVADILRPRVRLAYGASWPSSRGDEDSITVTFVCGYGAAASVPAGIRDWIRLQVGAMHENREAVGANVQALPFVDGLLDPYRVWD